MSSKTHEAIQIAGAGPAGLAAAITLAQADRQVVVHEARPHVGYRFGRDFQGLENWTSEQDVLEVLEVLAEYGMTTEFRKLPGLTGTAFDAWGNEYHINSTKPIYYMVERGPGDRKSVV